MIENYVAYDDSVEAMDIGAKLMWQNGYISTYQWDILMRTSVLDVSIFNHILSSRYRS